MLKWILGVAIVVWLIGSVISSYRQEELQAFRNKEQGLLLAQMEAIHNPTVSTLVDDWRNAYPEPTEEKLTELRVMVQRVKSNPAEAAKFTTESKQKGLDKLNEVVASPFRGDAKADGPGL